mgnify:CR=1 FL=1
MSKIADLKNGENKDGKDQLDLDQLSQSFESLYHRCAFMLVALENIAFGETSFHRQAANGVGYYTADLLDEMVQIQGMINQGLKSGVQH